MSFLVEIFAPGATHTAASFVSKITYASMDGGHESYGVVSYLNIDPHPQTKSTSFQETVAEANEATNAALNNMFSKMGIENWDAPGRNLTEKVTFGAASIVELRNTMLDVQKAFPNVGKELGLIVFTAIGMAAETFGAETSASVEAPKRSSTTKRVANLRKIAPLPLSAQTLSESELDDLLEHEEIRANSELDELLKLEGLANIKSKTAPEWGMF